MGAKSKANSAAFSSDFMTIPPFKDLPYTFPGALLQLAYLG